MLCQDRKTAAVEVYSPTARRFHWWTVAFILVQVPIGVIMHERGERNIWDGLTNSLYSLHKLIGILILVLIVARLVYRLRHGAPADEPTLEWWQKAAAHATHWGLYALLLALPVTGWAAISLFDARDIFGLVSLPAISPVDQAGHARAIFTHKVLVFLLILALAAHIGAALFHHLIRKDGVLTRMLPGLRKKG